MHLALIVKKKLRKKLRFFSHSLVLQHLSQQSISFHHNQGEASPYAQKDETMPKDNFFISKYGLACEQVLATGKKPQVVSLLKETGRVAKFE